jgi:hypothetical protein
VLFLIHLQNIQVAIQWKVQDQGEILTVDILTCFMGYIGLTLLLFLFAGIAYLVNKNRLPDDPAKIDLDRSAILLTPLWPFMAVGAVILSVIKAVFYGIFLILFSLALLLFRKPFFCRLMAPIVTGMGTKLMRINTFILRLFTRGTSGAGRRR